MTRKIAAIQPQVYTRAAPIDPVTGEYERLWGKGEADDFFGIAPLPDIATIAEPGTVEKMLVLGERARLKQQLHHPDDPKSVMPYGMKCRVPMWEKAGAMLAAWDNWRVEHKPLSGNG